MKYFAIGVAIILGSLGLVVAFMLGVAQRSTGVIEANALRFVGRRLPTILDGWSMEELRKDLAPPRLRTQSDAEFAAVLTEGRERFGRLVSHEKATLQGRQAPTRSASSQFFLVQARLDARFQRGSTVLSVGLVRQEGKWKITDLRLPPNQPTG